MFDFEKLEVYHKAKLFNKSISNILKDKTIEKVFRDKLRTPQFVALFYLHTICIQVSLNSGNNLQKQSLNNWGIPTSLSQEDTWQVLIKTRKER